MRRPGRLRRLLVVGAIVLGLVVAGYGGLVYLERPSGATTLVVYTYSSLLGGTCGANTSSLFAPFEAAHGVQLEFECPSGTLASTLIQEKGAPVADVVIGLDEVTAAQAEAAGVLVPYPSPALADVSPGLVAEIAPDHAVTPYEWGYLGVDVCPGFANRTGGAVGTMNLSEFAANASWARNLIVEDPTVDIVGEEFLLWEIQYSTQVLHQDWKPWWSAVAPKMTTASSWDAAFALWSCGGSSPQMVVSYLNDPAYAAYTGAPGSLTSSVSWHDGTPYGWKTIYGAGIVQGSAHLALDRELVDWMLGPTVQAAIPTSEWEFPANTTQGVPSAYAWAMNSSLVHPLNDGITPAAIAANLTGWLEAWQATVNAAP
jgi:thiamine transport system substrate-binding protein